MGYVIADWTRFSTEAWHLLTGAAYVNEKLKEMKEKENINAFLNLVDFLQFRMN